MQIYYQMRWISNVIKWNHKIHMNNNNSKLISQSSHKYEATAEPVLCIRTGEEREIFQIMTQRKNGLG